MKGVNDRVDRSTPNQGGTTELMKPPSLGEGWRLLHFLRKEE